MPAPRQGLVGDPTPCSHGLTKHINVSIVPPDVQEHQAHRR